MLKTNTAHQIILILGFVLFLVSCGGGGGSSLPQTDQNGPTVLSVSPAENQLDVIETDNISITFDEGINENEIQLSSIVIKKIDTVPPITLQEPISSYNYTSKTKTLTFTPKAGALKVNSRYRILLRNIKDNTGNLMVDKTWEFETISNPGGKILPSNGVLGVSPSSFIKIIFTKSMDLSSLMVINQTTNEQNPINFTLTEASVVIPNNNIIFSYDVQSNTATYKLKTATANQYGLKISTAYQVILSNLAMGSNGIRLTNDIMASFTTGVNLGIGIKPVKPNNVFVVTNNNNADISWDEVAGNRFNYNLYLSSDGGINFESISTNIQGTIQTNPQSVNKILYSIPITKDIPHLYALTAVENDVESIFSLANEVTLFSIPEKPTGVQLTVSTTPAGISSAVIEWDYISGLTYNLLVSVQRAKFTLVGTGGITAPLIGTIPNQKVRFPQNNLMTDNSYQYQVIAINSKNRMSAAAVTQTKTPTLLTVPPTNVSAIFGDAEMTLSWNNPDPTNPSGFKYNVYLTKGNVVTKIASNIVKVNLYQRITNNMSYKVSVSAVDVAGQESIQVFATDSNNETSFFPVAAAAQISSSDYTCSIRDNGKGQDSGSLWCWGGNYSGQLGNGTRTTSESPVQVGTIPVNSGLTAQIWDDWIAVSVGYGTTCGIRKVNGTGPGLLYCWGNNSRGNLGLGVLPRGTNTTYPQLVLTPQSLGATLVNWTKVSVGEQGHTCAIHSDTQTVGELFCWGYNFYGQLGNTLNGATAPDVAQPEPVAGLNSTLTPYKDWLEISVGVYRTCGIRQNSVNETTAWCWGYGAGGALGSNNLRSVNIPIQEGTLGTNWTSIATASSHSCVVNAKTNTLWCWGRNFSGSLGSGNYQSSILAVQEATLAKDWIKVFANFDSTCGLKSSGQMSCWGKNLLGHTGNAITHKGDNTPLISILDNGWKEIAMGREHTCGLTLSKNSLCWGSGGNYKLGTVRAASASPVASRKTNGAQLSNVVELDASIAGVAGGGSHVMAFESSVNKLHSWGNNTSYQVSGSTASLPNYQAVTQVDIRIWKDINAGEGNSCAILASNNTLWCWGRTDPNNFAAQPKFIPTQIGVDKWRDISMTGRQSCGIKLVVDNNGNSLADDKTLWCWGRINTNGQLGIGNNTTVYKVPTKPVLSPLTTPVKWLAVGTGNYNTCAITTTNTLYCWGRAVYNIFGNNSTVELHNPTNPVSVTASWREVQIGTDTACSITNTNKLYCWGRTQSTPTLVTAGSGTWLSFDVGKSHICAIDAIDNTLWCWGDNKFGQLGTGKFVNSTTEAPAQVRVGSILARWSKVTAGDSYTCAVRTDEPTITNALWCWGKNSHGELGDRNAWKLNPVPVILQ